MKKIKQFKYYNDNDDDVFVYNSPSGINYKQFLSGNNNIFKDYCPILQLGVQALPGTKFYLNSSSEPVVIGSTGIYEIDLNGEAEISALAFSLESLLAIRDNDNAYLIVDIIYDTEED